MVKKEDSTDEKYIRPKIAEKKFKLAKELRQTVYLYGIIGTGKTVFVKDMLKRKSYKYYSAKEISAEKLKVLEEGKVNILVVDDLQEVQSGSKREEYVKVISELSEKRNVWLILISRCRIPQWLMPVHVEQNFFIIGEEDFQFDRTDQDTYFEKWGIKIQTDIADHIWNLAKGNPLFLRFVALSGGDMERAVNDMWSYFFSIYDQWEPELQEFVMEMSVVERFDVRMAQIVTGKSDVQRIIKKAIETGNFFKEKDGLYECNFILRSCIHEYLEKKFDHDQIDRIYYNAGHMYEIYGDIPNALRMHLEIFQML